MHFRVHYHFVYLPIQNLQISTIIYFLTSVTQCSLSKEVIKTININIINICVAYELIYGLSILHWMENWESKDNIRAQYTTLFFIFYFYFFLNLIWWFYNSTYKYRYFFSLIFFYESLFYTFIQSITIAKHHEDFDLALAHPAITIHDKGYRFLGVEK